ncbi:MAG: hypothetical protein ACRERU_02680 [Methylococcales bacterium]
MGFAETMSESGISSIKPSEGCTRRSTDVANARATTGGEVEAALAKLPLRGLQILRPSLLLGERQEFRLGEKVGIFASKRLSFLFVGPLRKYRAIEASSVAYAMVQIAQQNVQGVNIFESWQLQAIAARK